MIFCIEICGGQRPHTAENTDGFHKNLLLFRLLICEPTKAGQELCQAFANIALIADCRFGGNQRIEHSLLAGISRRLKGEIDLLFVEHALGEDAFLGIRGMVLAVEKPIITSPLPCPMKEPSRARPTLVRFKMRLSADPRRADPSPTK